MKRKAVNGTTTAGERLQNQRPHPPVKIEDQEGAHEVETGSGLNTIQKNILAYEFRIRMTRQVPVKKCARSHLQQQKRMTNSWTKIFKS